MIVQCSVCGRRYQDVSRWTICPHGPLDAAVDDYCTMHDLAISRSNGVCVDACKDAAKKAKSIYLGKRS